MNFWGRLKDVTTSYNNVFIQGKASKSTAPSQPNFKSVNDIKNQSQTAIECFSLNCRLSFCCTEFMEMHSTSCSHPPPLLTVLHSHPHVVTCNYNHVAHSPLHLVFGRLEKTLILPVYQLKVTHSALRPFSPLSSVLPCCLLILLHQLTFKVKRAFKCSFHWWKCCVTVFWSIGEPRRTITRPGASSVNLVNTGGLNVFKYMSKHWA